MPFVIMLPLLAACGLSVLLSGAFGARFNRKWWLLRLTLVPLIAFCMASYVLLTPAEIPANYDPAVHGNPGRQDFLIAFVFGLVIPVGYLALALPLSMTYAYWRSRLSNI